MKLLIAITVVVVLGLVGCGGGGETATTPSTAEAPATSTATGEATTAAGDVEPIVVPTLPAEIPGYTEVDPATGLHVTGTPQVIDLADYRLKVTGKVNEELDLTYDEVRSLPKVTATPTLICPGVFEDTTTWSGATLETILGMAGLQPEAKKIKMKAADGYWVYLSLEEALRPENFLAYEWMGQPLPVLHGFPLRAVVPDKPGSSWVKWLLEIEVE
jgi:DMSO/TMAO reductase YedYZ molybdopterin-dependent catalytic subunit